MLSPDAVLLSLLSLSLFSCVSMSQIMQHHGCRSHMRDRNKLTGLEERFDLVVDSNDVILERAVRPVALWRFLTVSLHAKVFAKESSCCM